MTFRRTLCSPVAVLILLSAATLNAQPIPAEDARNVNVIDGNMHFTMPVFASRQAWQARAGELRKQILASAGLLPMPAKTPLHAQVFGKLEREGYSVEKVLLETYPGFYLGGNLYRPLGKTGPFPAVLSPHGHWDYGRLENTPIVSIQARGINLARQGFVVLIYDMVGYNDTNQIPHGDSGPRLGVRRDELWNISTMGLQLWNSIRSADFLTSLPDVDPERLSMTGASGGGTQTFLLTAVDDRIRMSAPVNMISFIHQGGGCQEAANLRVDLNNVVIGAMMAPRPMLMVSASGDWTRNTPREEFPAVQGIYRLFNAEQNVEQVQIDSPHNYNQSSREQVYTFLDARTLNTKGHIAEQKYRAEQVQDMLALYNRTLPANAVTMEQYVADRIKEARQDTLHLRPHDAASLALAREAFQERLRFSMLASAPLATDIVSEKTGTIPGGEKVNIGRAGKGDRIPSLWLSPRKANPDVAPTLIVHPDGIEPIASSANNKDSLVGGILGSGGVVLAIDAFQTGSAKAARDTSKPGFAVFNRTNDANRVQDILSAITYLKARSGSSTVNVIGFGTAGVWTYFARALAGSGVSLAADLNNFQIDNDAEFLDKFFIPGLRKAGDFHAGAVLGTQGRLLISNAPASFPADWVRDTAALSGFPGEVRSGKAPDSDLLRWVTLPQSGTQAQHAGNRVGK
jgi:dienelactone hydrolase